MSKRGWFVILLAVSILATGVVNKSAYAGSKLINWRVVGTYSNVYFADPTDSYALKHGIMIDIVAKGPPGDAIAKVVGIPGAYIPAPNPHCVSDSTFYDAIEYEFDDMVVTFNDQSMLFAALDYGYACLGPMPSTFHLNIVGGTGKYEGATGYLAGTFVGGPVSASGILWWETGSIVGEISK